MVIVVVLRPHVLRHAGENAEHKSGPAVKHYAAKQAAMATVVHQREDAQRE